jgi:transcriptional regulator with XRE-family HTH domain
VLGVRIRELRTARGMTVVQLAAAAGVSTGLISQVERGLADPSLETLRKISRALETPLFNLFQDHDQASVAVVTRARRVLVQSPTGGITYSRVSPGHGRLEVLEGHLLPGGTSSTEPWAHPSEECVLVLHGQLVVEVAGQEHVLDAGDSCYFDSTIPHRYVNRAETPVDFIVAVTPPSY